MIHTCGSLADFDGVVEMDTMVSAKIIQRGVLLHHWVHSNTGYAMTHLALRSAANNVGGNLIVLSPPLVATCVLCTCMCMHMCTCVYGNVLGIQVRRLVVCSVAEPIAHVDT